MTYFMILYADNSALGCHVFSLHACEKELICLKKRVSFYFGNFFASFTHPFYLREWRITLIAEAAHLQPKHITKYTGLHQMLGMTTGQILTSGN